VQMCGAGGLEMPAGFDLQELFLGAGYEAVVVVMEKCGRLGRR
jgi:hypothetical protein